MKRNIKIRSFWSYLLLFLGLGLFCKCNIQDQQQSGELHAGVAVIDITPPLGYPVHKIPSDGILDSIEVKTIVFKQNDCCAALIVADLFYIPLALSEKVRKLSSEKTGIPVSNICVAATHTHADPTCYEEIEQYIQKMNKGGLRLQDEQSYAGQLINNIVNSVVKAKDELRPVNFKSGSIKIEGISYNRRHLMKDGTVKMNGGFLNPDIIRAVGPVDPELGVILLSNAMEDRPFASLLTFAMQLATIGQTTKFSSGFPHFIEKKLQSNFDNNHVSIFGEGPCADVNHWDITKPGPQSGYEEVTKPTGERIAGELLAKLDKIEQHDASLAISNEVVKVPLQTFSKMDLEWAKSYSDPKGSPLVKARVRKILMLEELRQKYGDKLPLEIQVFRLNRETAIVALPGQIFVELGLAIKEASPFKTTLIVTLANSHEDCIPIRKAYTEGSYEIVYSLVETGGGEMLVETAVSLLKKIKDK